MANEPSWDELFSPQPAQPEATRPYSIDPEPVSAAPVQSDEDPFAALFGGLTTGPSPVVPAQQEAPVAPAQQSAPPEFFVTAQQPVPTAFPAPPAQNAPFVNPEPALSLPPVQDSLPVQQAAPPGWPVQPEAAPADPFAGLFGSAAAAPAPLVEPPAPAQSADAFAAVFAAPQEPSTLPPASQPAFAAPVAAAAVPTTEAAPLTRREMREREANGGIVAAASASVIPASLTPAEVAPAAFTPAAAPVAAAVPSAAEPVDFFASLASPAPAAAVPPAATADDVFPFDFGGGNGGGSNSGSGGGFGGGSGGGGDRQRPDQPKKRRNLLWLKITLPIVIVLGLVGGGAAYAWLNYETQVREFLGWQLPNDYEGAGNGEEAIVTIQSGDLGSDVANTLKDAGVTMTFDAFYDLLLAQPDNVNFLPGNYALQKQMSAQAALDALLDPANKVTSKLLITEGTTLPSALEIIAETTGIPLADVQAAVADPTVYGVPAGEPSLEGYLFPATYELDGSETAQDILQLMVDTMFQHLDDAGVAPENRHTVLTLASIIQREAGSNQDDFYKIARVFQNRLDQGINLQSDATVAYGTGNLHTVWTTDDERADASNLYNTYANPGLPIGPIGLPGDLAIQAALNPADGPWLFFVPINLATGETVFSETAEEHEAAVDQLHAWCDESEENASYCE